MSEIVDYKDGELQYVDRPRFQKLFAESGIDALYTVENFDKHTDVLPDGFPWVKHSAEPPAIYKEVLQQMKSGDLLCIKGVWESQLPKFAQYILRHPEAKVVELN